MRKAGTRYESPCSASGTISRIVARSACRVRRFGSSTALRYSSISAADTAAESKKRPECDRALVLVDELQLPGRPTGDVRAVGSEPCPVLRAGDRDREAR